MKIVLDANALRSKELRALVSSPEKHHFVLPDLVLFESAKSKNRPLTFRSNFEILAQIPDRIFVAKPINECIDFELNTLTSLKNHAVFKQATQAFRQILTAIREGRSNAYLEEVFEDPKNHIVEMNESHLDHKLNKKTSDDLIKEVLDELDDKVKARIKSGSISKEEMFDLTAIHAPDFLFGVLRESYDVGPERALRVVKSKSFLMRYFYVRYWSSLVWARNDEYTRRSPVKVSNDVIDQSHVMIASFFDDFLTNDGPAKETFIVLKRLLQAPAIRFRASANGISPYCSQ